MTGAAVTRRPSACSMHDDAILLTDATRRFGDAIGIADLSMRIPSGSLVGMIGPSGAGKTTSVRLMTGSLAPDEGSVRVLGEDPRRFRARTRRRIGSMPQQFALYPDLTARENVDFAASLFGMQWPSRRRRVEESLRGVELWDVRNRRAGHLSGGMQRRLALAATLVHDPVLMFLDEPTAGIDPILRARIWEELRRLRDAGRTLLVTTQYVGEAEECDVVALVAAGRLVALDTPEALRASVAGGELVEIATDRPAAPGDLEALPEVRAVTVLEPRRLRVTVESAAQAIPSIVERLTASGLEVKEAAERRLSFDEVFAVLVRRADAAAAADAPADPALDPIGAEAAA